MARKSRSQQPNFVWHVMSRGVRKAPIFLADKDRADFIGFMSWALDLTEIDIISYCLMDNHFHMLMRGAGQQLSRYMQLLNARYASRFNRNYEVNGHLFQGRFLSYPSKSIAWMIRRSVYIHMNPVEAGIVEEPSNYPWSSYANFTGRPALWDRVSSDQVLQHFGTSPSEQFRMYKNHVRDAIPIYKQLYSITRSTSEKISLRRKTNPEQLRVQIFEVLSLHETIKKVLSRSPAPDSQQSRWSSLILIDTTLKWNIGTKSILATVLGCSKSNIDRIRALTPDLLKSSQFLRSLLQQAQGAYLTST